MDNPLIEISQRFATRTDQIDSAGFSGQGGELSFGDFFSGKKIGLFGGIEHRFEHLPLRLWLSTTPIPFSSIVIEVARRLSPNCLMAYSGMSIRQPT